MKKYVKPIGALLLAILFTTGIFAAGLVLAGGYAWGNAALAVCYVLFAVLFLFNVLFRAVFGKHMRNKSIADHQRDALDQHRQAEQNLSEAQKRFSHIAVWAVIYLILLFVLAAALAFFGGAASGRGSEYAGNTCAVLFSVYVFYGFFCRLFRKKEKPQINGILERAEYPKIYAVLDRVLDRLDLYPPDYIATDAQFNAGVFPLTGRHYVINLGVQLLSVSTEAELEQLLLHEAAHMANRDVHITSGVASVLDFLAGDEELLIMFTGFLFNVPAGYLFYRYGMLLATASSVKEARADAAVKQYGDSSVYAGILAKLNFNDLYQPEADRYTDAPLYAPEEPEAHYNRKYVERFVRAAEERGDFWRKIIEQELPALMDSHPTFHERWNALGNCPYEVRFPDIEHPDAFTQECLTATDRVDQFLCEKLSENYSEAREENYLKPLKIVEEWEQTRELLPMDQMTPILNAYMALLRYDEAERLCDRLLDSDIPSVGLAYAKFIKGNEMLSRYDPEGISLLDEATDNHNFAENALNTIILFCRRMGMREELEIYRNRLLEEGQKDVDLHQPLNSLNPGDRLSVEHLPENRQEEITDFILRIANGCVSEIYLVRKTVTDDFFASVFVIRFQEGTESGQLNDVMDQIFEHLDKTPYDWQYALFLYEPGFEKIFRKLPGTKIYPKQ